MRYLLDTNTCIDLMKNHGAVIERISLVSPGDCAVSVITSFELFTGVAKCKNPARERTKVEFFLILLLSCQLAGPLHYGRLRFVPSLSRKAQ